MARTFAVGDIHGSLRPLRELLDRLRDRAAPGDTLLFIGDYIDRGPESRQVIDTVLEMRGPEGAPEGGPEGGPWPGPVVTLKGNHEAMLLEALDAGSDGAFVDWVYGCDGRATVASYSERLTRAAFLESLPPAHMEFLRQLRPWYEDEHALYVHAGIRPGRDPGECSDEDLLWIREEFIHSGYRWPKPVVFGHTPQYEAPPGRPVDLRRVTWRPLDRPEKIGIDTGHAYGGPLTAVVMPDREFLYAR